jgi:glycosyltransferase involved in cell wall biosynthesis
MVVPKNPVIAAERGGSLLLAKSRGNLHILRIMLTARETSAPYNQFSLPWAEEHDITICTYFASDVTLPSTITLFEGNGSLRGFFRALKAALGARQYDIIHAHSPHVGLLFLFATLFSFRRVAPSTVITVHDSYQNYKFRNRLMFMPVFAGFQKVVCCGQASYDSFPAFFRWLAGDRMAVVCNGLDIARVDRIAADASPGPHRASGFTVIAISRLVAIKDPFSLVTAFQQSEVHTSRLLYFGDGPLRQSLIERSRSAGLSNQIEFTGMIPRDRVFEHLLSADLFISTSRGEGLPVAVLEAMACGCPVVLSDIPPHREIAEGVDFIPLIQPGDAAGFAREIKRFREMPVSERRTVGRKCRELVKDRFSLQAMLRGYADIYAQIAGNHVQDGMEVLDHV